MVRKIFPACSLKARQSPPEARGGTSLAAKSAAQPKPTAMQRLRWTVDGEWSNVASRQQQGPNGPPRGRKDGYGRASARQTKTDAGNPALLGRHPGRRIAPATL